MKHFKKSHIRFFALLLALMFLMPSATPVQAAAGYKKAYKKVIASSKSVRKYVDCTYYDYDYGKVKFTKYFTYDLDKNGTPELFVYSKNAKLWAAFTYRNGKVRPMYTTGELDGLIGINKKTHEVIERGHSRGAGGSQDKEYSFYVMNKSKKGLRCTYYIDCIGSDYYIWRGSEELPGISTMYKSLYSQHVKGMTKMSAFKSYKIGSKKGIK